MSRRQLLTGALLAFAGMTPAVKALGAVAVSYDLVREGRRVNFQVGEKPCWILDPDRFGGTPTLTVEQAPGAEGETVHLALTGARFPGTDLPADLEAEIAPGLVGPTLRLRLALGGFAAEAPFHAWLMGLAPLAARVRFDASAIELGREAGLVLSGSAQAVLTPDWHLRLEGDAVGQFAGWGATYNSDSVTLALLSPEAHSIRTHPVARRTLVALERGSLSWPAWPLLASALDTAAGQVEARANHLDLLRLELGETARGGRRAALLAEPLTENKAVAFRLKGPVKSQRGQPFRLPLRKVRFGVDFDPSGDEATVTGTFPAEPVRARSGAAAYMLGQGAQTPTFELTVRNGRVERLTCMPAVASIDMPLPGAMVRTVEFPVGTHLDLAPEGSTAAAPPVAVFPLKGSPKVIAAAGDTRQAQSLMAFAAGSPPITAIQVIRPVDLLVLRFAFTGFHLDLAAVGGPAWVPDTPGGAAYLSVEFPPQHIAEQFFPINDLEEFPNPADPEKNPPIRHIAAAPSRLVFAIPAAVTAIRHTLKDLLNWSQLVPNLSPAVDRSAGATGTVDAQTGPDSLHTALEIPYRLMLSPDQSGTWRHRQEPRTNGVWTELWHTQLSQAGANLFALWTPDQKSGTQDVDSAARLTTRPNARQRKDLVRLTTERALPGNLPVNAKRLALSALGGWLDSQGFWPDAPLNTELWRQSTVMGRDSVVRIVTKGFLFPFGHRAALDEIIERKVSDNGVAYLRYKSFLVVRERVLHYAPPDQPDRRDLPFRSVEILAERTPVLDRKDPVVTAPGVSVPVAEAFWPIVGTTDLLFNIRTTDWEGQVQQFAMPLAFVVQTAATDGTFGTSRADAIGAGYKLDDAHRKMAMQSQSIAYAPQMPAPEETGSEGTTSTSYPTLWLRFGSRRPDTNPRPGYSLMFRPVMEEAQVTLPSVEALTGSPAVAWVEYYRDYVDNGFDDPLSFALTPSAPGATLPEPLNPDEIFALVKGNISAKPMGEAAPLITPAPVIKSLSRLHGASGIVPPGSTGMGGGISAQAAGGSPVLQGLGGAGLLLGMFALNKLIGRLNRKSESPFIPKLTVEFASSKFSAHPNIWGIRIGLTWLAGSELFANFPPDIPVLKFRRGARVASPDMRDFTLTPHVVPGTPVSAGNKFVAATYAVETPGGSSIPFMPPEPLGETAGANPPMVFSNVAAGTVITVKAPGTFPHAAIRAANIYISTDGVHYYFYGAITEPGGMLLINKNPDVAEGTMPTVSTAALQPETSLYLFIYFLHRFDKPIYLLGKPKPTAPAPGELKQPKNTYGVAVGLANFDVEIPDWAPPHRFCFAIRFARLGLNAEALNAARRGIGSNKKDANKVRKWIAPSKKSGEGLPIDFSFTLDFGSSLSFFRCFVPLITAFALGAGGYRAYNTSKSKKGKGRGSAADVQVANSAIPSLNLGLDVPLPSVMLGMFAVDNLFLKLGFDIPLGDAPLEITFGLCDASDPFMVRYGIFGGGGAFVLTFYPGGLRALEAAIEIGLCSSFSVAVAEGRIYAMIGIRLRVEFYPAQPGGPSVRPILTGYVRAGGEFEVLGMISASITFIISLTYDFAADLLWGVATLTVNISMLFFSISVSWEVRRDFRGSSSSARAQLGGDEATVEITAVDTGYLDAYCGAFAAPQSQEVSR